MSGVSSKLLGLMWAVSFAAEHRFAMPRRERAWKAMQGAPFAHAARHGVAFELVPGEYIDQLIYVEGIFERRFLDGLRAYFERHPGDVMLDVGCNIGNHSCYLARQFRAVHAFDPNPAIVDRLRRNVALNRLDHVSAHGVGLGEAPATLYLHVNREGNLGGSYLSDAPGDGAIAVPVAVGDALVRDAVRGKVDLLKVDVEGHELPALRGLQRTIAQHRPIVAFEFHAHQRPPGEWREIAALLDGYVFTEPCHAPPDASAPAKLRWHLQRCGRPVLQRIATPEPRSYHNILAFPDEAAAAKFDAVYPRP
jgi:FkbM family methyltransferase